MHARGSSLAKYKAKELWHALGNCKALLSQETVCRTKKPHRLWGHHSTDYKTGFIAKGATCPENREAKSHFKAAKLCCPKKLCAKQRHHTDSGDPTTSISMQVLWPMRLLTVPFYNGQDFDCDLDSILACAY